MNTVETKTFLWEGGWVISVSDSRQFGERSFVTVLLQITNLNLVECNGFSIASHSPAVHSIAALV